MRVGALMRWGDAGEGGCTDEVGVAGRSSGKVLAVGKPGADHDIIILFFQLASLSLKRNHMLKVKLQLQLPL